LRRAASGRPFVVLGPREPPELLAAAGEPGEQRGLARGGQAGRRDHAALDVLALEGDRIKEVTSFITRTTGPADREYFARWPDHPVDPAKVTAVFERFGLPARLD
jgi:hypothetical protein